MRWLFLFCFLSIYNISTAQVRSYILCLGDSFISPVCAQGTTVLEGLENLNGPGKHKIRQWCIDNGDTLTRDSFYIMVYPEISVYLSPVPSLCEKDPHYSLSRQASPAGGIFYVIGKDSAIRMDTVGGDILLDPSKLGAGEFKLVYRVSYPDTVCSSSDTVLFTVNASPKVSLDSLPALCDNDPPFNLNPYGTPSGGSWHSKTKPLAITGTNVLVPSKLNPGIYWLTYTYTDSTGCDNSDSVQITIKDCTSGMEDVRYYPFSISPNPSRDFITITGNVSAISKITLVNALGVGRAVKPNEGRISLESMPSGMYFIQLQSGNKIHTLKVPGDGLSPIADILRPFRASRHRVQYDAAAATGYCPHIPSCRIWCSICRT